MFAKLRVLESVAVDVDEFASGHLPLFDALGVHDIDHSILQGRHASSISEDPKSRAKRPAHLPILSDARLEAMAVHPALHSIEYICVSLRELDLTLLGLHEATVESLVKVARVESQDSFVDAICFLGVVWTNNDGDDLVVCLSAIRRQPLPLVVEGTQTYGGGHLSEVEGGGISAVSA